MVQRPDDPDLDLDPEIHELELLARILMGRGWVLQPDLGDDARDDDDAWGRGWPPDPEQRG